VWWVLLLPLVQFIAAAHLISHIEVTGTADDDSRAALHLSQCDVCPVASSAMGGAPPVEPATVRLFMLDASLRVRPQIAWVLQPADQPYLSRAPPVFSS
jgi:hypothetical protein